MTTRTSPHQHGAENRPPDHPRQRIPVLIPHSQANDQWPALKFFSRLLEDGRQVLAGHIASDESSPSWPHPRRCAARQKGPLHWGDLTTDGPQKSCHLASNGGDHHRQLLAGSAEPTIPGAQPKLCFPSDIAHRLRQAFDAGSQCLSKRLQPRSGERVDCPQGSAPCVSPCRRSSSLPAPGRETTSAVAAFRTGAHRRFPRQR